MANLYTSLTKLSLINTFVLLSISYIIFFILKQRKSNPMYNAM